MPSWQARQPAVQRSLFDKPPSKRSSRRTPATPAPSRSLATRHTVRPPDHASVLSFMVLDADRPGEPYRPKGRA